jgi:MFS family permease
VVALVLAAVALVLQQVLIVDPGHGRSADPSSSPHLGGLLTPTLRQLLVSDILVRFCEQIPFAFVVVWCVSMHEISALQFGVLTTIEMATAVLVYIPVAYLADRSTKKPFVVATFAFFTAFPLMLLWAKSFWLMVAAFVVRGLKEFGEPTRKALIMDLAPDGKKAATFGLYYLIRDVIVSIAAFGGALLWDSSTAHLLVDKLGIGQSALPFVDAVASPQLNLIVAAGFGVLGTVYFALFGRDLGPSTA